MKSPKPHASAVDFGFATEAEIRQVLGERLRQRRIAQGLTQAEVAERSGFTLNTLSTIERTGRCTLENFIRAVMALGLVDEIQPLFLAKITSIADMERAEEPPARRVRKVRK